MDTQKIERIWNQMTSNEQDIVSIGVFPARFMNEKLTNQESAELIRKSQAKTGVRY